jgi:hypothetical protein
MKIFFAPMMIGMLAFAGASPATGQSKSDPGTSVRVSTTRDADTQRNSYTRQSQDELRVWQQKLHDFDAKVQVKATDAQTSTSKDLNSAWAETKTAYSRLETAGEKDWNGAKTSFKSASDKLAVAWQKVNPNDK